MNDDPPEDDTLDEPEAEAGWLKRVASAPRVPLHGLGQPERLPARIGGRYRPLRFIAEGGMGRVYEVQDERSGERLALKLLLPALLASPVMVERFKREARTSARLHSRHVARVRDADLALELDGAPFLVMDLLVGMDLEQAASAPLPLERVLDWLGQAAEAVDEAHAAGIVHRDLKPANLFLAQEPQQPPLVKVLDFGVAKLLEDSAALTAAGQTLGTPRYMAPEQIAREPLTPACDLYALGLIAYRLLAGTSYHQGSVRQTLLELLAGPLQPASQRCGLLDARFDAWFARACERDPQRRFSSAAEQVAALATALAP